MLTLADYEAWKLRQHSHGVGAAEIVLDSIEDAPDAIAGDLNLTNEFGKATGNPVPPAPLVKEYRGVFQKAIERERRKTVLSSSPRLTEWLRNPGGTVATGGGPGLIGAVSNAFERGDKRVRQSFVQLMANDQAQVAADKSRSPAAIFNEEFERNALPVFGLLTTLWNTYSRTVSSQASNILGHDAAGSAADYQQTAAAIRKQIATIPMSPAASAFRDAISHPVDHAPGESPMSVPDAVPMSSRDDPPMSTWKGASPVETLSTGERLAREAQLFIDAARDNPGGAAAFMAETGLESIPQVFAAVAAGAVTRSPAVAGSFMFASSAATEAGIKGTDIVAEKSKELGIDLSTRDGALAAISNPEIMEHAATDGWARGLTVAAFDTLGFGIAGRELSRSPVGNFIMQTVVQALTGGAGEAAGSMVIGDQVNAADVITEALAGGIVDTPVEMGGWAITRFQKARDAARSAEGRRQFFQELSGAAQASKLRNRMPDRFRDFVAKATENGPVENLFIPAQEFVTYFQGLSVDPFALVDELDGVTRDDLEIALAGGGDLRVPTATYAAKIAGSEHDAFLMENMRFNPDDMTAREAAEFTAKADEALQEAWETAEEQRCLDEDFRSFEQEIYDTVVSRLRTAGRSTDESTTAAMLYVANYRTAAADDGVTIEDYMAAHPLPMVEGDLPQGMQLRDVDELNRSLAEARKRRETKDSRQSLLEFIDAYGGINDAGGELRSRNARTVKRQRGKRAQKLKVARGLSGMRDIFGGNDGKKFGASDVAEAAISAGFMADHPIALAYQEALRNGTQIPDLTRLRNT